MNDLGFQILEFIAQAGEGMITFAKTPYGGVRIGQMPRTTYYHVLDRLEKGKLIVKNKSGRSNSYQLTEKGKAILRGPIKKQNHKDGNATFIIFDIPEEKSKQRQILRRYLKKEGYTMLQKSIFISPHEITQELIDLIRELKIRPYVSSIFGKVNNSF
jgi:phenylacetic acid degradation operon negative regulatory protein